MAWIVPKMWYYPAKCGLVCLLSLIVEIQGKLELGLINLNVLYLLLGVNIISSVILPDIADVAFGLMFLLGVAFAFINRRSITSSELSFNEKALLGAFAAYSLVSIVSYFYWSHSRAAQMRLEDYGAFLLMIPFYFLMKGVRVNSRLLVYLFAVTCFCVGLVAVLQVTGHALGYSILGVDMAARATGGVNAMRFAGVSLMLAGFILAWMLAVKERRAIRLMLLMGVAAGLVAMILSMVRGSWVAVPLLGLLYLWFLFKSGRKRLAGLTFVVGLFLFAGISQTSVFQQRLDHALSSVELYMSGDTRSTSISARFDMYKVAIQLIKERPIWGHGLSSYSPKATEIRNSSPGMSWEVGVWKNPHNEILQVLVEKGVIGLITLILLFAVPWGVFWRAIKSRNSDIQYYGLCGLCLLVVFMVTGQTMALFEHDEYNHFFIVLVLLFVSQIKRIEAEASNKNEPGMSAA